MQALKRLFSASSCEPGAGATTPAETSALGTYVGDSKACPEGGRLQAKVEGRYVTILRFDGKLSCIDSICFHAGGPLGIGDIEDINGRKCLVCPWHYYKIDIQTGDKYYQGMHFENGKMVGGEWRSNGVQQRVHSVMEANDKIYVTLSTKAPMQAAPGAEGGPAPCGPNSRIDSDGYAFDAVCGDRVLNAPPVATKARVHSIGADGRKPAGQVLRGQYHS